MAIAFFAAVAPYVQIGTSRRFVAVTYPNPISHVSMVVVTLIDARNYIVVYSEGIVEKIESSNKCCNPMCIVVGVSLVGEDGAEFERKLCIPGESEKSILWFDWRQVADDARDAFAGKSFFLRVPHKTVTVERCKKTK
jgi:hypothetical protein